MTTVCNFGFLMLVISNILFVLLTVINCQSTFRPEERPALVDQTAEPEFSTKTCTPSDFLPTCSLSCCVTNPSKSLFVVSYNFTYYASDVYKTIPLFNYRWSYVDYSGGSVNAPYFNLTLPLSDFNAGNYMCTIVTKDNRDGNITTYKQKFLIDSTIQGKWLGSPCETPQECYAINATCDNRCKCQQHNYIKYNGQDDTTACLSAVAPGGKCLSDSQCGAFLPGTHCNGNECVYATALPIASSTTPIHSTIVTPTKLSNMDIIALSDVAAVAVGFIVIVIVISIIAVRVKSKPMTVSRYVIGFFRFLVIHRVHIFYFKFPFSNLSWIGRLLWKSYRNTSDDNKTTYDAPEQLKARGIDSRFQRIQKQYLSTKSLWKLLTRMIICDCLILSIILLVENCFATIIRAHFLGTFASSFSMSSDDDRFWFNRYGSAIILLTTLMIIAIINPLIQFYSEILGSKLKVTVITHVYNKLLKVITPELKKVDVGHMINVFATDVSKFEQIGHHVCSKIFNIISVLGCLIYVHLTVGIAGTIGLITMIVISVFSTFNLVALKYFGRKKARLTDQRLKLTTKMITEIRTMKLFCLENTYQQSIDRIRRKELKMNFIINCCKMVFHIVSGLLSPVAMLSTIYIMIYMGQPIVSSAIYSTFAVFNILQCHILVAITRTIENLSFLLVALERIKAFLRLDEWPKTNNSELITKTVTMKNVVSSWHSSQTFQIERCFHINVSEIILQKPSLTMIIGPVGSGKSTLLMTMLNEMYIASGDVHMGGSVTYMPQEPWLFPSTIKQNIIFGLPFDQQRYDRVIFNCALQLDLEILAQGDRTIVDDKGLTLSGGQLARIALARAMYRDSDIYLLDDPLSAVDVNVGKHIWNNCLMGSDKIIVLVSHLVHFINDSSNVVYVDKGFVSIGKYDEMKLPNAVDQQQDSVDNNMEVKIDRTESTYLDSNNNNGEKNYKKCEENALLLYCKVISSCFGGYMVLFGAFLLIAVCPTMTTVFTIYFSKWLNIENQIHSNITADLTENQIHTNITVDLTDELYLTLPQLAYLAAATVILFIIPYAAFFYLVYLASHRMQKNMLNSIMKTSLSYFDTHNTGSIVNRFSKDVELLDDLLPNFLYLASYHGLLQVGVFAVAIYGNYIVIVPLAFSLVILLFLAKIYMKGVEPIKRMEASARSSVYTYMNSTVRGLPVIRYHNNEEIVKTGFEARVDNHSSVTFLLLGMSNWLGITSQFVSTILPCGMVIVCIIWPDFTDSSKVGIGLSAAFLTALKVAFAIKLFADANQQILAVKRIKEYIDLPSERGHEIGEKSMNSEWPTTGQILFKNLTLTYGTTKKQALKNLNFEIETGKKVGIVGRTGAGKSSMVAALFRLANTEGSIIIDGIDISTLPLIKYREKISIIPQNPATLFGSIRNNLDPSNEFSDEDMWGVLESVQMKDAIRDLDEGMDQFSVGQKQLFCLARTLLRKNKIIILDEATSNVDNKTDQIINKLIRTKFPNSTMIIIAHRLQTVIDLDKIMVIQNGEILEFGDPNVLLSNPDSSFKSMVDKANKH
ncbi:hypothetical protein CHUAL_007542 [Chamberlinius hualienensis]